jgi:hypothetical protein
VTLEDTLLSAKQGKCHCLAFSSGSQWIQQVLMQEVYWNHLAGGLQKEVPALVSCLAA